MKVYRSLVSFLLLLALNLTAQQYKVVVVGAGYVGLVLAAGLAEFGSKVVCVDIDTKKIDLLNAGIMPIYEDNLQELVMHNIEQQRLFFSTNITDAISKSDIIFIAVGTPNNSEGVPDISSIISIAESIAVSNFSYKIVCVKSTVPLETNSRLQSYFDSKGIFCDVVSNPEFLRQGSAVYDFFNPERIVIGIHSKQALEVMCDLYEPLISKGVPVVITDTISAEAIKYASNSFLAIKLAYVNELDQLCEKIGASILDVTKGMGLDRRIGSLYLKPGPGFGGSCLKKDSQALIHKAQECGVDLKMVRAAIESNEARKKQIVDRTLELLGNDLSNKKIALWGVAFKERTDDIRDAPSLYIVDTLMSKGASIIAFDNCVCDTMKAAMPQVIFADNLDTTIEGADMILILNNSNEFDDKIKGIFAKRGSKPIIFNTRK